MKRIILTLSLSLSISTITFAQKISSDNLPSAVGEAFKAKFSIAGKTSWELDYDNYQANFNVGNADFSATFDKDGKWLKTESFIKPSALPKNIKEFISKNYANFKADDVEKVDTPDKTSYDMELSKDELTYIISISDAGVLLKHEEKEEKKAKAK